MCGGTYNCIFLMKKSPHSWKDSELLFWVIEFYECCNPKSCKDHCVFLSCFLFETVMQSFLIIRNIIMQEGALRGITNHSTN